MNKLSRGKCGTPQPLGVSGSWDLIFEDHFEGAASDIPDLTKWEIWMQDQQRRRATNRGDNTFLDGASNLVIRTTQLDIGYGAELSAGGLRSLAEYGPGTYWEVRMACNGWSTFWGYPRAGILGLEPQPDPADGTEIDIVEYYSGTNLWHAVHWGGYGPNHRFVTSNIGGAASPFRTYGYHWDLIGNANRFYVDGELSYTNTDIVSTRTDQLILLTQETEGSVTESLAYVDYVRVWDTGARNGR